MILYNILNTFWWVFIVLEMTVEFEWRWLHKYLKTPWHIKPWISGEWYRTIMFLLFIEPPYLVPFKLFLRVLRWSYCIHITKDFMGMCWETHNKRFYRRVLGGPQQRVLWIITEKLYLNNLMWRYKLLAHYLNLCDIYMCVRNFISRPPFPNPSKLCNLIASGD